MWFAHSILRTLMRNERHRRSVARNSSALRRAEALEPRLVLTDVFVDPAWMMLSTGTDPDALGPATAMGVDAFISIQAAIDAALVGDTVHVAPGTYDESLLISKSLTLTSTSQSKLVVVAPASASSGIVIEAGAGDVALIKFSASGNSDGLHSLTTGNLVVDSGNWSGIFVRQADSITLQGDLITSQGALDLEALNSVTLSTDVDAQANAISIVANADGSGDESFTQTAGSTLRTTNDSSNAIRITVNTLLGGAGAARIDELRAGQSDDIAAGRVTIDANRGAIVDVNEDASNMIAANALLMGLGGVGAKDRLETTLHRIEGAGGAGGFVVSNSRSLLIGGLQLGPAGVTASGGAIEITTPAALTVTEDIIGKSVFLKSRDSITSGQDIVVNAGVTIRATNGNVILEAGDNLTLEAGTLLESPVVGVFLKADADNLDPGNGATMLLQGLINSKIGARAESDNDEDRLQIFQMGTGGMHLDGRGRADRYEVHYPDLPGSFGSSILVDDTYGGTDSVTVYGTTADDALFVTTADPPTTVETEHVSRGTLTSEVIVITNTMEALYVETGEGNDLVRAQPSLIMPMYLNGGEPCRDDAGVPPGDTLIFDPISSDFSLVGHSFKTHARAGEMYPVTFVDFETVPLTEIGTGAPQFFDFNHTNTGSSVETSPTEPGYTSVRADTLYGEGLGYGWQSQVQSFERNDGFYTGPSQRLIQDGHSFGRRETFSVDVPTPGYYLVGAMFGSPYTDVLGVRIQNQDSSTTLVENISSLAGHSTNITFVAYVPDTSLDLTFLNALVTPTIFGINALEVRPAVMLTMSLDAVCDLELIADGVTIDTFPLIGAPANSRVTVSTNLGTIVNPDIDPELMGVQIHTNELGRAAIQMRRPTGRGIASFVMEQVGGAATGLTPIAYVVPAIRNFDFNHVNTDSTTTTSPTMSPEASPVNPTGFISVLPSELYSPERGYGWNLAPDSFDDGILPNNPRGNLHRDGHRMNHPRTFSVDLPNDTYDVRLTMGYGRATQDMRVKANGVTVLDNFSTEPGEIREQSFQVTLTDGQLRLDFGKSLLNTNWVANGLEIRSATLVTPITFGSAIGDVLADNITVSTVTAHTQMPAGSIVTVNASLGQILNLDVDATVAGIQVPVEANGSVALQLRATSKSGIPSLSLVSTDGLHQGSIHDSSFMRFVVSPERRFDFNHIAGRNNPVLSPTAAGYLGVTRIDTDALHVGYGWVTSPNSSDNEFPADPAVSPMGTLPQTRLLYRDYVSGHAQLGGRTFQVDSRPGATYDVRIYTGNLANDQSLRASLEGVASSQSIASLAGSFTTLTFFGGRDVNGDGLLEVTVGNHGGISPLWMVNGLDIVESSIGLPPSAPLVADINGVALPESPARVSSEVVQTLLNVAISAWQSTGLTAAESARLSAATVTIADLGPLLGLAGSRSILIDDDGAGLGWSTHLESVDPDRFDLLTVLAHELGHVLGRADITDADDVMHDSLRPGTRHLDAFTAALDV